MLMVKTSLMPCLHCVRGALTYSPKYFFQDIRYTVGQLIVYRHLFPVEIKKNTIKRPFQYVAAEVYFDIGHKELSL